jgi:hypothetical protein
VLYNKSHLDIVKLPCAVYGIMSQQAVTRHIICQACVKLQSKACTARQNGHLTK